MKFCKNLQKIVVVSDPDWVPYWTNYKMLKKLIKQIPSDEDSDDDAATKTASVTDNLKTPKKPVRAQQRRQATQSVKNKLSGAPPKSESSSASSARYRSSTICRKRKPHTPNNTTTSTTISAAAPQSQHDQPSGGMIRSRGAVWYGSSSSAVSSNINTAPPQPSLPSTATSSNTPTHPHTQSPCSPPSPSSSTPLPPSMKNNPGEVSFFRLLHSEVRKVSYFFSSTTSEFALREKKVRDGVAIAKNQDPPFVISDGWSLMAKSIYRLYMDLSSLEMFAIVAYCSFSKILKKHDKVTGRRTRSAFMTNVVNEAPFMSYPKILDMMKTCAVLYDEVAQRIKNSDQSFGSPSSSSKVLEGLHDDERLFIGMIHRFNEEVMESAGMDRPPPTFYSMRDPTTPHEIRSLIEMTLTSTGATDDDHLRRRVESFRLYDRDRADARTTGAGVDVEDHCDVEDDHQHQQQQQQQQQQRQLRQLKRSRM